MDRNEVGENERTEPNVAKPVGQKDLHGTETEQNLRAALAGEGTAFARYKTYALRAREEGYEQIGSLFDINADNERSHAELWLKYLGGISDTHENLITAAGGEHYEWSTMYKRFAETAAKEGFNELRGKFLLVAGIEEQHENAYNLFVKQMESGTVFCKKPPIKWWCRNCGFTVQGECAPKFCPVCGKPIAYFQEALN